MYGKLVKLRYTWTAIALLIICMMIGIWYTKPVDIYGLDENMSVDSITITVTQPGDGKNETRSVSFAQGDASFDSLLDRVEGMEFIRPFRNLALPTFKKEAPTGDWVLSEGEYCICMELFGPEDRSLTIVCDTGDWEYRKSVYDADLPLKVTENMESPEGLFKDFWELAK